MTTTNLIIYSALGDYLNAQTPQMLTEDAEFFGEAYEVEDGRIVRVIPEFEPVNVITADDVAELIGKNMNGGI